MPSASIPKRPLRHTLALLALWIAFYASFTLFTPALLDDADSVHAEVAREMLLRHDWVTLYANGIRYLEKAPLLYWSMAASMGVSKMLGHGSAEALAVAARIPLALTVLALAFAVEVFARRAFHSASAGLYAALILLSSPGIFLFTRITIPDAMLCLWLTLAMLAFWMTEHGTEDRVPHPSQLDREGWDVQTPRLLCFAFAACCALGVLTKGLIGLVFPVAIVGIYLLLTRGLRGAIRRIGELRPLTSGAVFLAIAAPWHILIALANPTQGHPGSLTFTNHHWQVPLPTDGNVHGWAWFYFVNEQVLRYLNLRVPRDYDTVPLWLFWGLILIWLMPWSAFLFHAVANVIRDARLLWTTKPGSRNISVSLKGTASAVPKGAPENKTALAAEGEVSRQTHLLLLIWAALPLLFFSLSTRQEYYVLPALPAMILLITGWLAQRSPGKSEAQLHRRSAYRCTAVLLAFGTVFAVAALYFILRTHTPAPNTDLAALLQQNPGDYAMSMGHFLDLNAQALGLFRLPLAIAAASLFFGPLIALILRKMEASINPVRFFFFALTFKAIGRPFARWNGRKRHVHAATLALSAGAFGFLLAAHLGLRTFAPVLSSQQLAAAIAPQLQPDDLIVIHQEYEYGSTLGFYLQRPTYTTGAPHLAFEMWDGRPQIPQTVAVNPIHILTDPEHNGTSNYGRSSNLWYGSFFPDAPAIFETSQSLAQKWPGPRRIFLWQDLGNDPSPLPASLTPVYVVARAGGKEIVSNRPAFR
jgi:4-amino-4-deoxy-L-arabinose transferase-like glycosyltransferase